MQEQVEEKPKWERDVLEKTLNNAVIEQRRARRWGIFFKTIVIGYILFLTVIWYQGGKPQPILKDHVALIDIIGTIGQGQDGDADRVATSLRKAFDEPKVKAVILRINSPGGTPVQAAYIFDELKRLRALKPNKKVYSVVMDICASGGYFVASAADQIYANPSSIVGSIGVLMPNFGVAEAIKKLGVEQRSITSGNNKLFLDPFSAPNPEQIAFAKTLLNDIHKNFIKAVKEGRGDRLKANDEEIFSGLFWTGDQALKLGLIDGFGSAGYVAREVIGTEEVIDYTQSHSVLERIANKFGASVSKQVMNELGVGTPVLK